MIKNAPKRIYLQVGEDIFKDEDVNFKDLEEVTWCEDKINDSDICYIRAGKCYTPDVTQRSELLNAFFEYLDSLSPKEYDANSLTGHGENWLKSQNNDYKSKKIKNTA